MICAGLEVFSPPSVAAASGACALPVRLEAGGQSRRPSVALRQVPTLVRALVVRKPCHLALESCDQQGHRSQGHLEHT